MNISDGFSPKEPGNGCDIEFEIRFSWLYKSIRIAVLPIDLTDLDPQVTGAFEGFKYVKKAFKAD